MMGRTRACLGLTSASTTLPNPLVQELVVGVEEPSVAQEHHADRAVPNLAQPSLAPAEGSAIMTTATVQVWVMEDRGGMRGVFNGHRWWPAFGARRNPRGRGCLGRRASG